MAIRNLKAKLWKLLCVAIFVVYATRALDEYFQRGTATSVSVDNNYPPPWIFACALLTEYRPAMTRDSADQCESTLQRKPRLPRAGPAPPAAGRDKSLSKLAELQVARGVQCLREDEFGDIDEFLFMGHKCARLDVRKPY